MKLPIKCVNMNYLLALFAMLFVLGSCQKEEDLRDFYQKAIDPINQKSKLSKALIIEGESHTGDLPEGLFNNQIEIIHSQPSASITNDNVLFIPFIYNSSETILAVYLKIIGADDYWEIPIDSEDSNNYVLGVGIPKNVMNGSFKILYKLLDSGGNISTASILDVNIVSANSGCGINGKFPRVEGNDGMTVRTYDLGDQPGQATITYNTYTVRDRIDIRYNNQWIASTGALLDNHRPSPPIKLCSQVTAGDGFVGQSGSFTIDYDPGLSRKLDIYVSGCLNNGTQWYFDVYCPGGIPPPTEEWYAELPDCPCTYLEVSELAQLDELPGGIWLDCGGANTDYHYGAIFEARWVPEESGNPGQQCTYNADGLLITSGLAAGSPDIVSPRSCGPTGPFADAYTIIDFWGHRNEDMLPWDYGNEETVSCYEYLEKWRPNKGNGCTERSITDIKDKEHLYGNMSCEEVTLFFQLIDQYKEEYQNLWEYIHYQLNIYPSFEIVEDLEHLSQVLECEEDESGFEPCGVIKRVIGNLEL